MTYRSYLWLAKVQRSLPDSIFLCPTQAPAPVAFPMTTPQVPVYGMVKSTLNFHKFSGLFLNQSTPNLIIFFPFLSTSCLVSLHPFTCPDQLPPQMSHQMGGVPIMPPQPVMYNQPVLRPTNPFGPIPGTQVMPFSQNNKYTVQTKLRFR